LIELLTRRQLPGEATDFAPLLQCFSKMVELRIALSTRWTPLSGLYMHSFEHSL